MAVADTAVGPRVLAWPGMAAHRYASLGLGALFSLFAVGGRWDLPLAAWLAPVLLLRLVRTSSATGGLLTVWLVSLADSFFWAFELATPMPWTSVVFSILLGTVFTLPFVLDRLLVQTLPPLAGLFVFPVARAVCEFLLATLSPLGAAYGLTAVTQHANLPLLQMLAVTGPYAIGFVVALLATVVNFSWERDFSWTALRRVAVPYAALIAAILLLGGLRLAFFPPDPSYVRVAGIAPSNEVLAAAARTLGAPPTGQQEFTHLDPELVRSAYALVQDELLANTRIAARAGAKVVVWSENAAPLLATDTDALLAKAAMVARAEHIYIDVADNIPFTRDETHLIAPDGRVLWTYRKAHPIPGVERYVPGERQRPLIQTPFGTITNVICYDADFPADSHATADIMLVPGGDWREIAAVHTLTMAKLRAIENGYALVRVDFNGLSAAFDHLGHVLATQDTTVEGQHLMIADVPTRGAPTLYNRIGDLFAWACVAAMLGLIGWGIARRARLTSPRAV